ncbi:hypothetical protein [Pedobacter cryophilus]|nr:hypothetical protein [Pedobacter cryophilus]
MNLYLNIKVNFFAVPFVVLMLSCAVYAQEKIDRKALVERHTIKIEKADPLSSLTIGNGEFAMTVDVTGLQSFPDFYQDGVPLGTQSEWGWDSFKDTAGYRLEESFKDYEQHGRKVSYAVQKSETARGKEAADWFRQNAHRLQLGNFGLEFYDKSGKILPISAIKNIKQELNMYTGIIHSVYEVEGEKVEVTTLAQPNQDGVMATVKSALIKKGQLKIRLRYPYPTAQWADVGNYFGEDSQHQTQIVKQLGSSAQIKHQLQGTQYATSLNWSGKAQISEKQKHYFLISPDKNQDQFQISITFSQNDKIPSSSFKEIAKANQKTWETYWESGGAVDFSGSTDSRAFELERRVILSQYLMRVQEAGYFPPQETGLTYNSWFGKPHLEMHWWHGVHYALWGRASLLQKSTDWYFKVMDGAKNIAKRQGFEGVRWQKMTDNEGNEVPSSIGAMLVWQQPHPITYTELLYRDNPNKAVLEKYKKIVFATADFMASFAHLNPKTNKYDLGPGLIPAQERFKAEETFNPTYELCYWKWALETAQQWRLRLGMPREAKWDDVIQKIAPLPVLGDVYLAAESAPDSYTNPEFKTDHPSVFGAFGMLPQTGLVDTTIMKNTFNLIWKDWSWAETWGWDFPLTAMTAARLGMPEKAVDALLMNIKTNTYLVNGHNYQDDRLRIYMPGNGGLLTAVAMMCAGWDGTNEKNPGFPKDGTWNVRWEGLIKMP